MREWIATRILDGFSKRYDYDVSYMRAMLKEAPGAFFAFAKINDASRYRKVTPIEALYAVKLTGTLSEDCGPCAQLVVNMAREADMATDQIVALLQRDESAMHRDTALGFHFADA